MMPWLSRLDGQQKRCAWSCLGVGETGRGRERTRSKRGLASAEPQILLKSDRKVREILDWNWVRRPYRSLYAGECHWEASLGLKMESSTLTSQLHSREERSGPESFAQVRPSSPPAAL